MMRKSARVNLFRSNPMTPPPGRLVHWTELSFQREPNASPVTGGVPFLWLDADASMLPFLSTRPDGISSPRGTLESCAFIDISSSAHSTRYRDSRITVTRNYHLVDVRGNRDARKIGLKGCCAGTSTTS